ncbi:hypothetical protein VNI00_005858 [Paramarasmius palmivorus]|uniref:Protein kinase domain-containing protein n=1 Tax=Paramarasmius palmivorus TaxID=297713 RepID=A0AAW0DAU8_9AGAR
MSDTGLEGILTVEGLRELLKLTLTEAATTLRMLDPSWVPHIIELLQVEASLDPRNREYCERCSKVIRVLAKKYGVLPSSLFVDNITIEGMHPLRAGGFSDIWKGFRGEQLVCLKVLRIHLEADEQKRTEITKAFCNEALVWVRFNHPNVLPLFGVNTKAFFPGLCLVSPWMAHGDLITYLKNNPKHDRLKSIHDIASGLSYLHSLRPMVVHGDIKGANVLVNDDCRCCLADFGLANIVESQRLDSTASSSIKGTVRWMAPELLCGDTTGNTHGPRDIYAFACTVLEIITGKPPFPELREGAVIFRVINGERPSRPLSENPRLRPQAFELERYFRLRVGSDPGAFFDTILPNEGQGSMPNKYVSSTPNLTTPKRSHRKKNLKYFRVSLEDPTYKVLPAALKQYRIEQNDWRNYSMLIRYGTDGDCTERVLAYDEKPLLLFQELKDMERNPVFVLKRRAALSRDASQTNQWKPYRATDARSSQDEQPTTRATAFHPSGSSPVLSTNVDSSPTSDPFPKTPTPEFISYGVAI